MRHQRGLKGAKPFFKGDEPAKTIGAAKEHFAKPDVQESVQKSAVAAKMFLIANTARIAPGLELLDEPILTDKQIAKIKCPDEGRSLFSIHVSRQNAIQRVVSNGLAETLIQMAERGVVHMTLLESADSLIFDLGGEKIMEELIQRKELGEAAPVMTLAGALNLVYPNPTKAQKTHLRDVLTVLSLVGLLKGSYSSGDGYSFRAGTVLTQAFDRAINPALKEKFGFGSEGEPR